jgi:hypothetical protein
MKLKFAFIVSLLAALLLFALSCSGNSGDQSLVDMNVTYSIIPVESDGVMNLAYHVSLSNYGEKSLRLKKVEVINDSTGSVIASYSDSGLTALQIGPTVPPPTSQDLIDGTKKLNHPYLCIWLRPQRSEMPAKIKHRLTFSDAGKDIVIEGAPATIQNTAPVVIEAPVRGSGWLGIETTSQNTHHFKCEATKGGVTNHSERFAVDWLQYDSDEHMFQNEGKQNADWVCYGKELIAVADGVVTAIKDGVPENEPGSIRPLKWEEMAGNYVIIRIGENTYACYCHITPATIRVSVGQRVNKGDVLGLLGNSGNSDAPHLHFQITDRNSFYAAEGLPYVFDSFTKTGYVTVAPDGEYIVNPLPTPVIYQNRLMENDSILSFP